MDALTRAAELAEEHDLHAVCVTLRGGVPEPLRSRLLAEAAAEARGVIDGEGWAVWWAEELDDGVVLVLNGLAQDVKQALVDLEDDHPLGGWFNLDVVTALEDRRVGTWHGSPMREQARPERDADALQHAVTDYEWS